MKQKDIYGDFELNGLHGLYTHMAGLKNVSRYNHAYTADPSTDIIL